jgi:Flp pilus assembly pilin Flp
VRTPLNDRGAVSSEYLLLALFIAAVVVGGVTVLGLFVNGLFDQASPAFTPAP